MAFCIQQFRGTVSFIVLSVLACIPQLAVAQTPIRDGLVGVVTKSDRLRPSSQIVFANIRGPKPFVTWPSGGGDETNRVFEDDELIVLFYVAGVTGSTETFYLNKKTKRFTLVEVGALQATATNTEFKPMVTFGTLR